MENLGPTVKKIRNKISTYCFLKQGTTISPPKAALVAALFLVFKTRLFFVILLCQKQLLLLPSISQSLKHVFFFIICLCQKQHLLLPSISQSLKNVFFLFFCFFFFFSMTLRPIAEKKRRNFQLVPTCSRPPSFVSRQIILLLMIQKKLIVGSYGFALGYSRFKHSTIIMWCLSSLLA